MNRKNIVFVEKYRPAKIQECILPDRIKDQFQGFVDNESVPNLILSGGPGTGKTTVAKALCAELDMDYMVINGSDEGRLIDTLRNKIRSFCSAVSFDGKKKMLIIDEADGCTPDIVQPALRAFIEEFQKNTVFVFTCNYKNRIIKPIHSRCSHVEFKFKNSEKVDLMSKFFKRLEFVLNSESIEYEKDTVSDVIVKYFPDFRRTIHEIQKFSTSGKLDSAIVRQNTDDFTIKQLIPALKNKKFKDVRKWVVDNIDNDHVRIFRKIYDTLDNNLKPQSVPQAIMILGDYQYKSAFVADQEINLVSCLIEIMSECEFS